MLLMGAKVGFLAGTVALVSAGGAVAAPVVTGRMGVDLDGYTFQKVVLGDGRESEVRRTLTNPHLDLQAKGPLLSENFADYSLSGRLSGTYYRSSDLNETATGSASPSLTQYAGRLSFFARRAYPLGLHFSRTELPSLRYEVSNRAESDLESPALAVIRRYDSVLENLGGSWSMALPVEGTFRVDAERSENIVNRQYDFSEDRDIFVDFVTTRPDTVALTHPIAIRNEIPGETVVVFIDGAIVDTLDVEEAIVLSLDTRPYAVEFVPQTLNAFRSTVNVNGDMQWNIVFNPAPGSKDIAQTVDSARLMVDIGHEDGFRDEAYYEYSENLDDVQRTNTRISTLNNMARYDATQNTKIDFQTVLTETATDVVDVSSQSSDSFLHQSGARWQRRRGPEAGLSHSYARVSTVTDVSDVVSTTNTLQTRGRYPTGWREHEAGLRLGATYLQDNAGYRSRQYTSEVENRLATRLRGVRWRPRQLIKYLTSTVENPDGSTNEWEVQNVLEGEVPRLGPVGELKFKGELGWRRRASGIGSSSKKKWVGEVGVSRRVRGWRVGFKMGHEKETFGGSIPTPGNDTSAGAAKIEDQLRHTYRLDLLSTAWKSTSVGGNVMFTTSNDSDIQRVTAALSTRIPKIGLPIRSSYIDEKRTLTDQPAQTLTQLQSRVSLNFRQMSVTLNHSFVNDRQLAEEYTYQQLILKIARNFDVL